MENNIRWTDTVIDELIRKIRYSVIEALLNDDKFQQYCENLCEVSISKKMLTALQNELRRYQYASIDLQHYDTLVSKIKATDTASYSEINIDLFEDDIKRKILAYMCSFSFSSSLDFRR